MDTKSILLKLVQQAQTNSDECLKELFELMRKAVIRGEMENIEWYIMNDMSDEDILLLLVTTDVDLSVNFDELVLIEAVRYVFRYKMMEC
ncbi:conserved hypothetical protein [Vibrio chagasii]|nr:conserved hypothetical protein [Vibrio chagasii]